MGLLKVAAKMDIKKNIKLSQISYYKIGGIADYFVDVSEVKELRKALSFCKENNIRYYIIGSSSNILFDDDGYRGMVIRFTSPKNKIEIMNPIKVFAGESLSNLIFKLADTGYCGIEKLAGIPGTVGGAIKMNAGSYGQQMQDIVKSVDVLNEKGEVVSYNNKEIGFGYRKSRFQGSKEIILYGELEFREDDFEKIQSRIREALKERTKKQPLDCPSCGSIFKNPYPRYAAKLIEKAQLKGFSVGGAAVSDKHANFIINKGNATSRDVKKIIKHIQRTISKKFGVELEKELIFIGEFD